jgi:hypothetical protein
VNDVLSFDCLTLQRDVTDISVPAQRLIVSPLWSARRVVCRRTNSQARHRLSEWADTWPLQEKSSRVNQEREATSAQLRTQAEISPTRDKLLNTTVNPPCHPLPWQPRRVIPRLREVCERWRVQHWASAWAMSRCGSTTGYCKYQLGAYTLHHSIDHETVVRPALAWCVQCTAAQ